MTGTITLDWNWDDSCGCYRAFDEIAIYVISGDSETGFSVGYFPGPGSECSWEDCLPSLDEAKKSAERCIDHVKKIREELGLTTHDTEPGEQDGGGNGEQRH